MRPQDLHTHSLYDDGKATLEQMVRAALDKKLSAIGLSGHSPIQIGDGWTMTPDAMSEYLSEGRRLQAAYRDKIDVFLGIEYDLCSALDLSVFDYVIGSAHSIVTPQGEFPVDESSEIAKNGVDRFFGGDADWAAEAYFAQYDLLAGNPEVDIVGHFDLLTKYDEKTGLYDANSPRFLDAACGAMETLVRAEKIFELNSGAISRGYRTSPYPSERLLRRLNELGGKICLNSDAHSTGGVGFFFPEMLSIARNCGFRELWQLGEDGFHPVPISEIEA